VKFFYWLLHSFIECKDEDLDYFKDVQGTCRKCGRVHYIFHA